MSYVTTDPEALLAAATNLEGIGSAMAAQNTAAAAPTTGILPAAADEVSALQATQFDAYGTLYQQVSAQARAIQELFVHTLRVSAGSYGETETANSAAAAPSVAAAGLSAAAGSTAADPSFGLGSVASNSAILATMNGANVGSALSEFTGLGKGFITEPPGFGYYGVNSVTGAAQPALVGETAPASPGPASASTGVSPAPAATGQPSPARAMSASPGWTAEAAPEATPAKLTGAGWTGPAAHTAPGTTVATGMPAVASANRGGHGYGRPRYGVKPKVMTDPDTV